MKIDPTGKKSATRAMQSELPAWPSAPLPARLFLLHAGAEADTEPGTKDGAGTGAAVGAGLSAGLLARMRQRPFVIYHHCRHLTRGGRRHVLVVRKERAERSSLLLCRQHQGRAPGPDCLLSLVQAQCQATAPSRHLMRDSGSRRSAQANSNGT